MGSSIAYFSYFLAITCLVSVRSQAQNCARSCAKCSGQKMCAFNNATGCFKGEIDCSDTCLHIDVRKKLCFDAEVPNGKNCDESCNYCVKDYKCNIAMQNTNLCTTQKVVNCEQEEDCLTGPAKKLCNALENKGKCHPTCETCTYADDCLATNNSSQCINHNINCLNDDECVHTDVFSAKCFKASVPGNGTCSVDSCNTCITQFECNNVMESNGYCRNKTVDCMKQGICTDGDATKKCGIETSSSTCPCDVCFTSLNCSKGSVQDIYGNCKNGKLNCEGAYSRCYVGNVIGEQCETIGFCTLNKSASFWEKVRCFLIGVFIFLAIIIVVLCYTCCGSSGGGGVYVVNK